MRPGSILGFTPSTTTEVAPAPPPSWNGPLSSFEYDESWPGTLANPNYPATFTGFSTPSDQTPLESFEASGGWPGT